MPWAGQRIQRSGICVAGRSSHDHMPDLFRVGQDSVNPYRGQRPRITLSWNITIERLPGRPGEGWAK